LQIGKKNLIKDTQLIVNFVVLVKANKKLWKAYSPRSLLGPVEAFKSPKIA